MNTCESTHVKPWWQVDVRKPCGTQTQIGIIPRLAVGKRKCEAERQMFPMIGLSRLAVMWFVVFIFRWGLVQFTRIPERHTWHAAHNIPIRNTTILMHFPLFVLMSPLYTNMRVLETTAWLYEWIQKAADRGASLADCLVIEVFAGSSRLTACLCLLGLGSNFGVDHKKHKNAAGPIVVADLCTPEGVALLWSWLQNEQVLAIFWHRLVVQPPERDRYRWSENVLVILRGDTMDPDHREMMQTPVDYLVYLIRINKGFLWQINFIFWLHRSFSGPLKTGSSYVWKIRSSVCFGPRLFGNKLHIFWNIPFFIYVNMEIYVRRKQCLHLISLNFM